MMSHILEITQYITSAPYFWHSMGFLTACAMFVGAILFDGNLSEMRKGMFVLLSYSFFLLFIVGSRVGNSILTIGTNDPVRAWAGLVTIIITTCFYLLGMLLGSFVLYLSGIRE